MTHHFLVQQRSLMLLSLTMLLSTGCSDGGPDLGTVTGIVTLDGQPLPGALVSLTPESGRPSAGQTDETGKYELKFTFDRAGAHVGSHVVRITTAQNAENETPAKETIPARYNAGTELKAQVEPGANELDFELTSGGPLPSDRQSAARNSSSS